MSYTADFGTNGSDRDRAGIKYATGVQEKLETEKKNRGGSRRTKEVETKWRKTPAVWFWTVKCSHSCTHSC